jgi:WD40 repeat protein
MSDANPPKPREGQCTPAASPEAAEALDESTLTVSGSTPVIARHAFQQLPIDRNRYTISGEVARGGIGRVLRAQDSHLGRPVALKELLEPGNDARARFLTEAFVTARLQHPSIIPIYEAGRWSTGEPFYAMRLVSGRTLKEVIAETKTLAQRLALLPHVLAVAEAIAYAHGQRVIHRDLKPGNVLVGEFGETVVIDWGLAKDLSQQAVSPSRTPGAETAFGPQVGEGLTVAGDVMGTPAYMPPEQAGGQPVDERADVYALGAILYHLLAGVRPYDGESALAVVRMVMAGPPVPLAERQKGIPQELLTIVSKAMARAPSERYRTARELAEDLRRFQTGQIVGAHQYTLAQRLWRLVQRYRVAVAALVLLTAVGTLSVWRIVVERDHARRKEAEAVERADALTVMQVRSELEHDPNTVAWLGKLSPAFFRWGEARTVAADAKARGLATLLRGHTMSIDAVVFTPDGRRLITASDDRTLRVWDLEHGGSRVLEGHTDEVWRIALSPDSQHIASASKDGTIRLWELATGRSRVLQGHSRTVAAVHFLPDGNRLVSASHDGTLRLWNLTTDKVLRTLRVEGSFFQRLLLSPDGKQVVVASDNEPVARLWNVESGELRLLAGHEADLCEPAFSPRGDLIATGSDDQTVRVWNPRTGEGRILGERLGAIKTLAFSPDGRSLAASGSEPVVRLWDVSSGQFRELRGHEGQVEVLAFSPDGQLLASAGHDRTVRLWELSTGRVRVLRGPGTPIYRLSFSPEGQRLAVGGVDATVRLFDVRQGPGLLQAPNSADSGDLRVSSRGRLVVGGRDGTVLWWDLSTSASRTLEGHEGTVRTALSSDGRFFASGGEEGSVRLWDAEGQALGVFRGHSGSIAALAFSPDGRQVASAGNSGEMRLWDSASGEGRVLQSLEQGQEDQGGFVLAFSPDGRHLALAAHLSPHVSLWDVMSGQKRILRGGNEEAVLRSLVFSPDGTQVVTGSMDNTVTFWSLAGVEQRRIKVGGAGVRLLLFSPDRGTLYTVSGMESLIRSWDARTGQAWTALRGHEGNVNSIALSPDGKRLASASDDQMVRLWDLENRTSRVLRGHTGPVSRVAFSADGQQVISLGADGTVRLWPDDLPTSPEALRAWLQTVDAPPFGSDEERQQDPAR